MAKPTFILQGVTERFHANELRKMLSQDGCKLVLASVAYVRSEGIESIATQLKAVAKVTTFFIGIRNPITSIQAVKRLLELGVRVFAVDTASPSIIFHPKLYLAKRKSDAKLIIGSANLTSSGLHNNIEASTILDLDLTAKGDRGFVQNLVDAFKEMPSRFPDHVFQIKNVAKAAKLFDQGRLWDEDIVIAPTITALIRKGTRDTLKAMKLFHHASPHRKRSANKSKSKAVNVITMPNVAFTKSKIKVNRFFKEILGAKLRNPQQSWGAKDPHSNRVFLRIWEHHIEPVGDGRKVQVYWKKPGGNSSGYAERLEQIEAIKKGAQAVAIVCRAVDPNADKLKIKCFSEDPLLRLRGFSEDRNYIYAHIVGYTSVSELDQP